MNSGIKLFLVGLIVMLFAVVSACGNEGAAPSQGEEAPEGAGEVDFPTRNFDLTVPFSPGGGSDVSARLVEQYFADEFGYTMNFNYRDGAGGAVGMLEFANTGSDDGHDIATFNFPHISLQPASGVAEYQIDDFEVFAQIASDYTVFVVPADSPWETLEDFVNDAKSRPGELNIALAQVMEPAHMSYVQLIDEAEIEAPRITYQSGGELLSGILGGHVDSAIGSMGTTMQEVNTGSLRALAISASERLERFPDIPTFKEQGYGIETHIGRLWLTPAGVDPQVLQRLEDGFKNIVDNPEFQEQMEGTGFVIDWMGREEIQEHIRNFDATSADLVERLTRDLEEQGE
ncbi:tripartite tricarboxylate transporter substrate binding protein [Alkalihalobacillus oceani]|uniref:Tripartite tricarboxylate transporter substrate binding protein n=1 Tax=Halalkalibacter oceani TaxID=1653776 RepID=A0A9X2DRK2_9BACI|nr:tripartite tricarboxylate transporter substrate binding protein [Halalkalibacter oceani]MCM3715734.1 tripartite tricarboxylate transporter substrate binding protein [Halalkalibacter oceani]